jgi:hypothetical protein
MPRTLPTGAINEAKRRETFAPVILVDVELQDNATRYYWADHGGSYPMKIGAGGNVAYSPWVKSAGPFQIFKSLRTDGGTIVLQNISGNTIDRDVSGKLKLGVFERALCVVRVWNVLLAASEMEFHWTLSATNATDVEASFKLKQLFDLNILDEPPSTCENLCTLRYKSALCGSASGLATCTFDAPACVARGAMERFNGITGVLPPGGGQLKEERDNEDEPKSGLRRKLRLP